MLGLYLYTLIIGHKSCNMLGILNKLTLQKNFQNGIKNDVFWTIKKKHNNNKTKIKHKNHYRSRELNPGPLAPKAYALHLHQGFNCHYLTIVVKLFNCFDAIVETQKKTKANVRANIFNKFILTTFGSFSYLRKYVSTAKIWLNFNM